MNCKILIPDVQCNRHELIKDRRNRQNVKDYRGQRQRFQNKFIDNGNEPEIDMFSEAQAFISQPF